VVEIGMNSFEKDERFPRVNAYRIGDESNEFITEIESDETCEIINCEELKVFALNWYFNNIEIVKEINKDDI